MISIVWWTLGLEASLIKTFFNSHITLTFDLSSYMILILDFLGLAFSFSHTIYGITLEEAPEWTIQLWIFLLNISNVEKRRSSRFQPLTGQRSINNRLFLCSLLPKICTLDRFSSFFAYPTIRIFAFAERSSLDRFNEILLYLW